MAFFKRRSRLAVQTSTRLVREPVDGAQPEQPEEPSVLDDIFLTPEVVAEYAEIAKDFITHAAVAVTASYVICRIAKGIFK